MIRSIRSDFQSFALVTIFALGAASAPSLAQDAVPAKPKTSPAAKTTAVSSKSAAAKATTKTAAKPDPKKPDPKKPSPKKADAEKPGDAAAGKPSLVASYGDWGAYAAKSGSTKTCYALAQPKDRAPSNLKRDPAYIFISDRPAENVHNEVAIVTGFDVKGGDAAKPVAGADPSAEVGSTKFVLIAQGPRLWLKNAAEEGPMIAAMRKTGKLIVRAASLKGNVTTDQYSLSGLAQALDRIQKECQ